MIKFCEFQSVQQVCLQNICLPVFRYTRTTYSHVFQSSRSQREERSEMALSKELLIVLQKLVDCQFGVLACL